MNSDERYEPIKIDTPDPIHLAYIKQLENDKGQMGYVMNRMQDTIHNLENRLKQERKEIANEFYKLSEECGGGILFWKKVRALAQKYGAEVK